MTEVFLVGLVAGICLGGGGVTLICLRLVFGLFETHRQALAQALSSERVLKVSNDPNRPRSAPARPKSDMQKILDRRREAEEWERQLLGDK